MNGRKIVVWIPGFPEEQLQQIDAEASRDGFRAVFPESREAAGREAADAEILFTQSSDLCLEAPEARWICTPSAGVDHFLKNGIPARPETQLTNSSGAYGVTIAEHTVMVTLEMMRRKSEYNEIVRKREWKRDLHIDSIYGSRITLLGTGDIGRECAQRLRGFSPAGLTGVNRRGQNPENLFDRIVTVDRLAEVLPETDLLICSLPATAETDGLLDAGKLALLPRGARIVNVGRGSALDQKALERMLREGRLAGAALDVFTGEPVPAGDSLWDCPGLLITPHIAGNMTLDYTVRRIVSQFLEDLDNYVAGRKLRYLVNRERAY